MFLLMATVARTVREILFSEQKESLHPQMQASQGGQKETGL
jgi:hypothetical protein